MQDDPPSTAVIRFAGQRAAGLAASFLEQLKQSDVPPSHWEEVLHWLSHLLNDELNVRGVIDAQSNEDPNG